MSASPVVPTVAPVAAGRGLVKRYGSTTALDGATFQVAPGVTGLLGANGAGKTTLLGVLLGLHPVQAGEVEVLGLDPHDAGPEVRSRIGYSPEHHDLPPDIAAHDFVRHVAEVHGLPAPSATARASDALWWVGLGEERFRPLGSLSTGQRQRVKLAMAIAHDPLLVFLDEPTDGLDPAQRDSMLALIGRVATDFGMSVLLSSHLLDEVERTCHQVVILDAGRVVAEGPVEQLRGGARGVTVELDGDPSAVKDLAEALARRGCSVSLEGARIELVADGEASHEMVLRAVRDEVSAKGYGVRRLEQRVSTLEDVFLQAAP